MSRTFTIGLNPEEIDAVISELNQYEKDLRQKEQTIREELARMLQEWASEGFASASYDIVKGQVSFSGVTVDVRASRGKTLVVYATGEEAVFIEFGTGIYNNGAVGSSPHPKGAELGYTIGTYGKGMGSRRTWGYYEGGELVLTHGITAQMPMYNAVMYVVSQADRIAREVFS